ncbi:hypothetical protein BKA61DRAFT_632185 [Leptodontidium sp. MPI-SDFR-AT-0119]|nr:hypothetical protein BKA61DRAFT_632185 [Leptodontidium sp. MPI-SDFR-AT-0119]
MKSRNPDNALFELGHSSGLLRLNPTAPFTTNLINNHLGIPFNSPNDVVRTSDGALSSPQIPAQVCRWVPGITDIHVVADGLAAPNGKIAYTTDAAQNSTAPTASKTIYAYEVVMSESGPLLATRRTFAMPSVGIPDWIKTDKTGNVYAGCGDGVNGKLLGKILVTGGVADLALDQNGMVLYLTRISCS